jgi:hypothetical protein
MFGKTGYREGGTRGGQDRFKWDEVKEDKFRYVGRVKHLYSTCKRHSANVHGACFATRL